MTTVQTEDQKATNSYANGHPPVVIVRRRTIDSILISVGVLATVVLAVAGGLLSWGNSFASDYVGDELSSDGPKSQS